jgi:hypothetical protein
MRVPPPAIAVATAPSAAPTPAPASEAPPQPISELPASTEPSAQAQRAPSASSHSLRPVSYIVAGVGVAGLAAFGILGTLSDKEFSRLQSACPNGKGCDPGYRDNATRGQTYQTIANVSLGVGAAALVSGIVCRPPAPPVPPFAPELPPCGASMPARPSFASATPESLTFEGRVPASEPPFPPSRPDCGEN